MTNGQLGVGIAGVIILILAGVAYNTIALFEGVILIVLFAIVIPFLFIILKRIPKRDERHRINDEDMHD